MKRKYDESNEIQRQRTERYADHGAASDDNPHVTEEPEGEFDVHPADYAVAAPEKFDKTVESLARSTSAEAQAKADRWREIGQKARARAAAEKPPEKPSSPATTILT